MFYSEAYRNLDNRGGEADSGHDLVDIATEDFEKFVLKLSARTILRTTCSFSEVKEEIESCQASGPEAHSIAPRGGQSSYVLTHDTSLEEDSFEVLLYGPASRSSTPEHMEGNTSPVLSLERPPVQSISELFGRQSTDELNSANLPQAQVVESARLDVA